MSIVTSLLSSNHFIVKKMANCYSCFPELKCKRSDVLAEIMPSAELELPTGETTGPTLDEITGFCKANGFVFPSSEIYGGFTAIYDYGPRGVELENNVKAEWWKEIVRRREDTVGIDSSIFMNPQIWEASGHVAGFSDPLAECRNCNTRVRVDHLLEDIGIQADDKMTITEIREVFDENRPHLHCPDPKCGASDFTDVHQFNLLVASNLGNFTGAADSEPVWLRGETCQGIYVNYANVLSSTRVQIPFGIAQIGKAFRNEITARQFIFRTREFEQMENQRFVSPEAEMDEYERLRAERYKYYTERLGFEPSNLQWHEHEKLAFYALAAWDIEYRYPFGFSELEGVHARGDYDLTQHSQYSGSDLTYRNPRSGERYMPHVIESSCGVGRTVLAALCDAYKIEKLDNGNERQVLKLHPNLAPVKVAVFPLVRNKPEIVQRARNIHGDLAEDFATEFDDNGNTGKRYRRQDAIGTVMGVTVDYDTMDDGTVTVRDRDTMKQERVHESQLEQYVRVKLKQPYQRATI
jgi:glycyl-tRNA synthetase